MTDLIIIIILAVIAFAAIRGCINKKGHGCCGGGSEKKIKVQDKKPEHYPYKAEVTVEGMTCSHCKLRVENAFNEEGMWAVVDLKAKHALVRMKEEASDEELERLVRRVGYEATEIRRIQSN